MFVVYLLISAILLIIGMIIGTQNGSQFTDVYLLNFHFTNVPLNLVMLESFIFGVFIVILVVVFHEIKLRYIIFGLKKRIKELEDEILKLRNLPIEEMEYSESKEEIKEVDLEDK